MIFRAAPVLAFVLLAIVLGLPAGAQAKAKPHHASYAPAPTEAELFNALKKAVYGSQKDRSNADALFRRVLRNDNVAPVYRINYPVYGSSPQGIQASQAQTKFNAGISEWGYTSSHWSYQYGANQPVRLTLSTAITMPQWKSSDTGHTAAPAFWKSFYGALLYHEQGHVLIGEYVVALMRLRLNEAGDSASANANATCNQIGAALNMLNQQYDQRTNHGVSQGAVL